MTANTAQPDTPNAVPLHRRINSRGRLGPAAMVAIAVLVLGTFALNKLTAGASAADVSSAIDQTIDRKLESLTQTPATEPAPPPTTPGYDYLSCSHLTDSDPNPCAPVLVWPLTEEAKGLIGYQKGGIPGELNTTNTRLIYDQIRNKMAGVDACSLLLSMKRDSAMNGVLTVHSSRERATPGAVQLVDCQARGGVQGTIPTEGVA